MDTNLQGSWYNTRQGSPVTRFTYVTPVITDTGVVFCRVKASTASPVLVMGSVCVLTADSGITVSIGITDGGQELVNAASLTTAATGGTILPANGARIGYYFTADTNLWYKGSSGADTGIVAILLDFTEINTSNVIGL